MDATKRFDIEPVKGDALVIVDVQYDFCQEVRWRFPKVIKSFQCLTDISVCLSSAACRSI